MIDLRVDAIVTDYSGRLQATLTAGSGGPAETE